jgi:hypothetical protein
MRIRRAFLVVLALSATVRTSTAQSFDAAGTRAAGMGGAFVAVADDASAVFWNPAGLASASFFSLVMDRTSRESRPGETSSGGSDSGFILALGVPALGLSYYRLRATSVELDATAFRVGNLVTHHGGATLVQTVAPGLTVGATLKFVRGVAAAGLSSAPDRDTALDEAPDLIGRASNAFDADVGVMLAHGRFKAGIAGRNLFEPDFATPSGVELSLDRQIRAGVAYAVAEGWIAAADAELLRARDSAGIERRFLALGTEGQVNPRLAARAGARIDTLADGPGGAASTVSVGGSYAVRSGIWIDGSATVGSRWGGRGWGISARFVY